MFRPGPMCAEPALSFVRQKTFTILVADDLYKKIYYLMIYAYLLFKINVSSGSPQGRPHMYRMKETMWSVHHLSLPSSYYL